MLPPGSRIVLASHNAGKLREFSALTAPHRITVLSAGALGLPEPPETAHDFVGNARLKALTAACATNLVALADDSGFCVAALDGAPGVYSADWAGTPRDFTAAMDRVNRECAGAADMAAWFVCVLCLAWPDGRTRSFEGRVSGARVWPPRGTHGFGYDPMFLPDGETRTYGELDAGWKHANSHRAAAFARMRAACFA